MTLAYPLRMSREEIERLRAQADLFRGDAEIMLAGIVVRLGSKLVAVLHERGATDTRFRAARYALRAGEPMHYHLPRTLHAMRESIIAYGLIAAEALDPLIDDLNRHLDQPATLTLPYTLVQAAGVIG